MQDYAEGKGRRRMREFAIEASSSAMTVGTLVEDRTGEEAKRTDLGNEKTKEEGKEIGRGSDHWKAANAAGVERETKKCMESSMKKFKKIFL